MIDRLIEGDKEEELVCRNGIIGSTPSRDQVEGEGEKLIIMIIGPWCMLFTDDVVLIDTSREWVETKLKVWIDTLEAHRLKISRAKTEYTKYNFSGTT